MMADECTEHVRAPSSNPRPGAAQLLFNESRPAAAQLLVSHNCMHRVGLAYNSEGALRHAKRHLAAATVGTDVGLQALPEGSLIATPIAFGGISFSNACYGPAVDDVNPGFIPFQRVVGEGIEVEYATTRVTIPLSSGLNTTVELMNGQCYHGCVEMTDCPQMKFEWDGLYTPLSSVHTSLPSEPQTTDLHGTLQLKEAIPFSSAAGVANWTTSIDERRIYLSDAVLPHNRWTPCEAVPVAGCDVDRAVFVAVPGKVLANMKMKQEMSSENAKVFQALAAAYGKAAHARHKRALDMIGDAMEQCYSAPRVGISLQLAILLDEISSSDPSWSALRETLHLPDGILPLAPAPIVLPSVVRVPLQATATAMPHH